MSSSRALRTGFGSRTLLVSAGLLLVSLAASHVTAFRTHVHLSSGPRGLSLTVNGRTIRGAARLGPIRGIRIQALNSVYPMGGERLAVRQNGRLLFDDRLPRRFPVTQSRYAPLGDWYLDPNTGGGIVYERRIDPAARDVTIEATLTGRCLEYTSIVLMAEPPVYAQFRRGLLNNDFLLNVGGQVIAVDALVSPLPQMALDALDLLLRSLLAGCLLVLSFAFVRWLLSPREHRSRAFVRRSWSGVQRHWPALVAGALALIALAIRLWVSGRVLEALAHTPDEVAYMLQSKWIVSNNVYEVTSPIQEHLSVPFTYVRDGKWFSMYPIGWSLLLAIGQLVGLSWIVSPVCGAIYVLLLFLIGRELYGDLVGLAAAALGALSPMAILMSASYLSHASAAMMIALFLWLYLVGRRRNSFWLCGLSGASLGFAFAIRPMTALTVALPFAFIVLWEFSRSKEKREMLRQSAAFLVGGVLGSAPVFISNQMITGHAFSFTYAYGANVSFSAQNLPAGLMYLDATAASVLPAVFGWGWGTLSGWPILSLTLAFAYVPFLVGRARRIDGLLAAFLIALPLSFLTWGFHGLHGYGPRFYFEAFLGIYLLTSQGFFLLAGVEAERTPVEFRRGKTVAFAAIGLLGLLVFSGASTLRSRMQLYRGYNDVDGSLERAIASEAVKKALILFPGDDWYAWGAASNLLKADLHADIAFAVSRGDNSKLFAFYEDRPVYRWTANHLVRIRAAMPSEGRPPPASPPSPGRATTLFGWWLVLSAVGIGGSVLLRRGTLSGPALPAAASSEVPAFEGASPRGRPLVRSKLDLPPVRPLKAAIGVLSAYVGQIFLAPGGLAHRFPLFGSLERQLFHAGWLLLLFGAFLFGSAWRGFRPSGGFPTWKARRGSEPSEQLSEWDGVA